MIELRLILKREPIHYADAEMLDHPGYFYAAELVTNDDTWDENIGWEVMLCLGRFGTMRLGRHLDDEEFDGSKRTWRQVSWVKDMGFAANKETPETRVRLF